MGLLVRKAKKTETSKIADLLHALNRHEGYDFCPDPGALETHWDEFDTYVADNNGTPVAVLCGCRTFIPHNGAAWYEIQSLYVTDNFRRQGTGENLIRYVIREKHKEGLDAFIINVREKNELGNKFYQSLGMQDKHLDHHRYYLYPDHIESFLQNSA